MLRDRGTPAASCSSPSGRDRRAPPPSNLAGEGLAPPGSRLLFLPLRGRIPQCSHWGGEGSVLCRSRRAVPGPGVTGARPPSNLAGEGLAPPGPRLLFPPLRGRIPQCSHWEVRGLSCAVQEEPFRAPAWRARARTPSSIVGEGLAPPGPRLLFLPLRGRIPQCSHWGGEGSVRRRRRFSPHPSSGLRGTPDASFPPGGSPSEAARRVAQRRFFAQVAARAGGEVIRGRRGEGTHQT